MNWRWNAIRKARVKWQGKIENEIGRYFILYKKHPKHSNLKSTNRYIFDKCSSKEETNSAQISQIWNQRVILKFVIDTQRQSRAILTRLIWENLLYDVQWHKRYKWIRRLKKFRLTSNDNRKMHFLLRSRKKLLMSRKKMNNFQKKNMIKWNLPEKRNENYFSDKSKTTFHTFLIENLFCEYT